MSVVPEPSGPALEAFYGCIYGRTWEKARGLALTEAQVVSTLR